MSASGQASTIQLVAFLIDGARYGVSLSAAEQALRMVAVSALPGAPRVVLGAINLHGRVVPVVDLRRRLGLTPHEYGVTAHLLLVRTPRRRLAIPADEVFGVVEVDAGSVAARGTVLPARSPVAGVAALPDGLLFIHDLEAFLTLEEEEQIDEALEAQG